MSKTKAPKTSHPEVLDFLSQSNVLTDDVVKSALRRVVSECVMVFHKGLPCSFNGKMTWSSEAGMLMSFMSGWNDPTDVAMKNFPKLEAARAEARVWSRKNNGTVALTPAEEKLVARKVLDELVKAGIYEIRHIGK